MVRPDFLLAAALAASTQVQARTIERLGSRRLGGIRNPISTRETRYVGRDTPVAPAPSDPIILQPLRIPRSGNSKRDRRAALELKTAETLYWGGQDGTVAKLTIETLDGTENIVNLEMIDDMVRQVSCPSTEGEFKITFAEEADFDDAEDIWQWVNQEADNHFLLLVGAGTCGWNTERLVYNVTDLIYNDEAETAILEAKRTTWKLAAHTFDLTVGSAALPPSVAGKAHRRHPGIFDKVGDFFEDAGDKIADTAGDVADTVSSGVGNVVDTITGGAADAVDKVTDIVDNIDPAVSANPSFTIPLDANLTSKSLSFTLPGTSPSGGDTTVSATCLDCSTTGSLTLQAHFSARLFELTDAAVEVTLPDNGLAATALLGLTLRGDLVQPVSRSIPVFEFSPAGVSIPGVLTIGPTVGVSLGMELGGVRGSVTATLGARATVEGGSKARLDFLDENGTGKEGWGVDFEGEEFKVEAAIDARAGVFLRGTVGVEVSVLESGFAAELNANAPTLSATLKAATSTDCTVCGSFQNGVQGSLNLGTSIGVALTKKVAGTETPLWSLNFAEVNTPAIAQFCQGFGPQGDECLANSLLGSA
ncbi:hypothetical protein MMYC01_204090 [Madurella mycetomatis]|uniref:Uncharacterized protein n=1 Tax=Madurella mycetomatis TaxID=100816 RepID=A0A175W2V9_9PEZI|nr:hypothetical protein MMYC01_204804 [Madurella mycetomatis]KXX81107.1 hypothetical protein MMYC01_204090 [Madurella mycetomatis]